MTVDPGPGDLLGPRRALVAIDGSTASDVAIDLVGSLPWPEGSSIRVIECLDMGPGLYGGPWPALALTQSDELETALRAEAHHEIDDARERLAGPGRSISGAVEFGRPASVIVEEAHNMSADLVVVGSRGHGRLATMVLGSTSAEVVDHAPAPVLVARGTRIERIVLAWDGSPVAERAVDAVRHWPILQAAETRVVVVADVGTAWWTGFADVGASVSPEQATIAVEAARATLAEAERMADDVVRVLREAGRTAEADVREGDPADAIIAAAQDAGADLIVLGTHGRTGLARLRMGSVASSVVRHAPCSVLVMRAPEAESA
jgi:nucleotide-binding universal stress UspA family protein